MKPTHTLGVLNKKTGARVTAAVGWLNDNGTLTVKINPCVTLVEHEDLVMTFFPVNYQRSSEDKAYGSAPPPAKPKVPVRSAKNKGHNFPDNYVPPHKNEDFGPEF